MVYFRKCVNRSPPDDYHKVASATNQDIEHVDRTRHHRLRVPPKYNACVNFFFPKRGSKRVRKASTGNSATSSSSIGVFMSEPGEARRVNVRGLGPTGFKFGNLDHGFTSKRGVTSKSGAQFLASSDNRGGMQCLSI